MNLAFCLVLSTLQWWKWKCNIQTFRG